MYQKLTKGNVETRLINNMNGSLKIILLVAVIARDEKTGTVVPGFNEGSFIY